MRFQHAIDRRTADSEKLSGWRAAVFVGLVIAGLAKLYPVAALGLAAYVWLVLRHNRVRESLARFRSRASLKAHALPELPKALPPYFGDLDLDRLLGTLNRTLSTRGFARLLQTFDSNGVFPEEILRRQGLCNALARLRVLRRRFLVMAGLTEGRIDSESLLSLLKEKLLPEGSLLLWVFAGHLATLGLTVAFFLTGIRPLLVGAFFLLLLLYRYVAGHSRLLVAYDYAVTLDLSLSKLTPLMNVLERMQRLAPLAELLVPFRGEHQPKRLLRRAERIAGALGVRQNFLVHLPLNLVLPWDFFWTWRLDALRGEMDKVLPHWLEALAELEVFVSLAEFRAEHPELVTPELTATEGLEAEGLAHPLLPKDRRVGNDIALGGGTRCLLITGSNMSGKSTFLRSVGVNLLLAKAGTGVCARRFRFSPIGVATSLRVADSLEDGLSSFYAEVKRLAGILEEAARGVPLVYLIDEIFRGTNNRERLTGSRSYIRKLLTTPALGLVATHDLELAQLEKESPHLKNFHFKETLEGGKMRFTYLKAPGPCPTTNALKVMELAGLPVE